MQPFNPYSAHQNFFFQFEIIINTLVRGYVKLKKIQKSEKNWEVGGWVEPQLGFLFFSIFFLVFCVVFIFSNVSKKQKLGKWWVFAVWPIRVFLGFLDFF